MRAIGSQLRPTNPSSSTSSQQVGVFLHSSTNSQLVKRKQH